MLSQEITAELYSKLTYTENTLLLLYDVISGIKEILKELDKSVPYVFCGQATDYRTMAVFCKEHNVICLETYYKKKRRKAGGTCVKT